MDFPLKLFHGILHVFADGLDVESLCGSNGRVTQDRLHHGVRNTEPLEIRRQTATIGLPSLPLESTCLKPWLDYTVGEIVRIQRSANRVRKYPATRSFGLDRVQENPQGLDDRYNSGAFFVFVSLGLIVKVGSPN